ncbi:MAG: hypothetical protein P0Y52_09600 [Candidatus Brevundimonas phytovorans]|nr:hypothetical protein [Brevundimonas sp.]WEK56803.1 MAG: hypothetical protein P0Y52_09600 [Brevundimonas sp.]
MRILMAAVVMMLSACALPQADPARVEQGREAYEWVRDGNVEALSSQSTTTMRPQITAPALADLGRCAVAGKPASSRVVSWSSNVVAGGTSTYEVTQLLEYTQQNVLVSARMMRQGEGPWLIDGIHLNVVSPAQVAAASGFSLQGKSPLHYAVLAGVVLAPLLCLVTAGVAAWRRRWGWMAASLFGVAQIALNWSNGAWQFQPINVAFLSAAAVKGPGVLEPWILMVWLPLPALLFWILKRYRTKALTNTQLPQAVADA